MEKSKKKEKTKKEQILARNRDLLEGALATGNVNGDDCAAARRTALSLKQRRQDRRALTSKIEGVSPLFDL